MDEVGDTRDNESCVDSWHDGALHHVDVAVAACRCGSFLGSSRFAGFGVAGCIVAICCNASLHAVVYLPTYVLPRYLRPIYDLLVGTMWSDAV